MAKTRVKKPSYRLTDVQYSEALSEETACFSALVVDDDGVDICRVRNHGHGGADLVDVIDKKRFERLNAYVAKLPPTKTKYGDLDPCLELFVGELLNNWINDRTLRRMCQRATVFRIKTDAPNVERIIKRPYTAEVAAHIRKTYGKDLIEICNETLVKRS